MVVLSILSIFIVAFGERICESLHLAMAGSPALPYFFEPNFISLKHGYSCF